MDLHTDSRICHYRLRLHLASYGTFEVKEPAEGHSASDQDPPTSSSLKRISPIFTSLPPKRHQGALQGVEVKSPVQDLASSISSSSLCRGMQRWRCSCRRVCTARPAVCRSSGSVMSSRPARRCSLLDDSYSCRASCSSSWKRCTVSGQSSGSASVESHRERGPTQV